LATAAVFVRTTRFRFMAVLPISSYLWRLTVRQSSKRHLAASRSDESNSVNKKLTNGWLKRL